MKDCPIPTFVINRKERTDRYDHIIKQFQGKAEFDLTLVEAIEDPAGAVGLWNSIVYIVKSQLFSNAEYILICEDDHQFTEYYSKEKLLSSIENAHKFEADILSGGVSWLDGTLPVKDGLFWIRAFTGTQFLIVFRTFFSKILKADFKVEPSSIPSTPNFGYLEKNDLVGFKLCSLTQRKFFIYPFVSIQKEFGYSDVTGRKEAGDVEDQFDAARVKIETTLQIQSFYSKFPVFDDGQAAGIDAVIPTYIINLPERKDRKEHILNQFKLRSEFNITVVDAFKHEIGAVGLWITMRKIISMANETEADFILICEDDHVFTEWYNKEYLFKNIIEAHNAGANILSGGAGYFGLAVPITKNRYWINPACCTQFTIVYRKFFMKILNAPYDNTVVPDIFLSELTTNRMVLYPYVSVQRDFGYSDATASHNLISIASLFDQCSRRLEDIQKATIMLSAAP